MSQSISLADFRTALTTRGAAAPMATSLLARMPIAMISLALLFYVQRATGSFADAGLVSAAVLCGVACGSVSQSRVADRIGPSPVLVLMACVFGAFVAAEIIAVEVRAAVPITAALAFAVGLSQPTVGPASRALWTRLLPPGPARDAAYSYEAISMEVFFILGPGLAGVLVTLPWPGAAVVAGASCMIIGSLGFACTAAARSSRPRPEERPTTSVLGPLTSPGMRTVALAALGFGTLVGFVEVAAPAAATDSGFPAAGGLLLSAWSVSSVLVGVLYGMRPWPRAMRYRLPALLGGFAVLITLLALPDTLWGLCLAMLLAGTTITPQATAHSVALEDAAPAGTTTEAFGWVITSVTLGSAFGQSASGQLVESTGPPTAFITASVVGVLLALWLLGRRGTLRPASTPLRPVVETSA